MLKPSGGGGIKLTPVGVVGVTGGWGKGGNATPPLILVFGLVLTLLVSSGITLKFLLPWCREVCGGDTRSIFESVVDATDALE